MTRFALASALVLLLAPAAQAEPEGLPIPPPFERGRLGIQVQPMTPELREHMGAPEDAGVLVVRVEEGSAAAEAGVKVGDVITSASGEAVEAPFALIQQVVKVPEGERLTLGLVRDADTLEVEVTPKGRPSTGSEDIEDWMRRGFHHGR